MGKHHDQLGQKHFNLAYVMSRVDYFNNALRVIPAKQMNRVTAEVHFTDMVL